MEKQITIPGGSTLEEAVEMLQKAKENGEQAYCIFNGTKLHSDTITLDSAYLEVTGKTKEEHDKFIKDSINNYHKEEEERKKREDDYAKKIEAAKTGDNTITKEKVVDGLKFIAENQNMSQEELIDGLIDLGCTFSLDDIKNQFPEEVSISSGMKEGSLASGATVIANARDNEFGRDIVNDYFLAEDNDQSIYHVVRVLTEDDSYTKKSLEKGKSL